MSCSSAILKKFNYWNGPMYIAINCKLDKVIIIATIKMKST